MQTAAFCCMLQLTSYIRKMLVKFGMEDAKASKTPMDAGTKLSKKDEPSVQAERSNFPYRELVASLLFASICCRPDIAFAVKELSRFLNNPGKKMIEVAKRVLRYLARTIDRGLLFHHKFQTVIGGLFKSSFADPLCAFSDADFAAWST